MSTVQPIQLPEPSEVLSSIRSSCQDLRIASNITINQKAIREVLLELNEAEWKRDSVDHGIRLPLRFESDVEELNIISILSILNFLSGYRIPLHRLTSRGAWSNILAIVLSAHLASTSDTNAALSTNGMLAATPSSIAALAQIQTHNEEPHPTMGPAVTIGVKDAEAFEILELLAGTLNETGKVLKAAKKKDLGTWVKDALMDTQGDVGEMLDKLVSTFPAFSDMAVVDNKPVYFYKKALFLLNAITDRWGSATGDDAPSFPLPDTTAPLPIFVDNVIPTMLVHLNFLDLSNCTDPVLSGDTPSTRSSLSKSSAARLRAASVDCCVAIAEEALAIAATDESRKWLDGVTEVQVDAWLWGAVAKKGSNRDVPRFQERETVFY